MVASLFRTYADGLGIDLSFQSFTEELDGLPGQYTPPTGEILVAYSTNGGFALGCVALRPFRGSGAGPRAADATDEGRPIPRLSRCEMKRLYVSTEARGLGLGESLAKDILGKAAELGYSEVLLDTLPTMTSAIRLYEKLGFVEIPAYYTSPIEGTKFYCLSLPAVQQGAH